MEALQILTVFGLFNVPAKWYAWILLVVFQLLLTNVSLLGHLSGILSGFAYTCGLFNFLLPGTSFYSAMESSSWLLAFVRQPKFLVCTGGNPSGYILTYSSRNTTSRQLAVDGVTAAAGYLASHQGSMLSEEEIQKLVAMGIERTQIEAAVAAADGDLNVAMEILMTQLG